MTPRTATDAGAAELDHYLLALFGRARRTTFLEVRWRVRGGMRQRFIPVGELDHAQGFIRRLAGQTDVFVGALPRWRRAGGRAAVVGDCRTVWVDLDIKTAARALEPVDPAPTVRVATGGRGHLHAYWSLRAAVAPGAIERANRRLAWALGGDLSSADASRILRPPSTLHHARGAISVRLDGEPKGELCRLWDLVGGLPDPPARPRRAPIPAPRHAGGDRLLGISPDCYVPALTGETVGRDRKMHCPLHDDRVPSLHVYPDPAGGWFCFGCRRGGTIYDLAAALWLPGTSGGRRLRGAEFLWVRDRLTELLGPAAHGSVGGR
jgi:CHC2 zinc finger